MSKREAEEEAVPNKVTALVKRAKADDDKKGPGDSSRAIVRSSEGSIIVTVRL